MRFSLMPPSRPLGSADSAPAITALADVRAAVKVHRKSLMARARQSL